MFAPHTDHLTLLKKLCADRERTVGNCVRMYQISPVCLWQESRSPNRPRTFGSFVQKTIIPNTTEIAGMMLRLQRYDLQGALHLHSLCLPTMLHHVACCNLYQGRSFPLKWKLPASFMDPRNPAYRNTLFPRLSTMS